MGKGLFTKCFCTTKALGEAESSTPSRTNARGVSANAKLQLVCYDLSAARNVEEQVEDQVQNRPKLASAGAGTTVDSKGSADLAS